jgi:hypothetical protein
MSTKQPAPVTDGPSLPPKLDYELLANGDVTRTDKDSTITVARYDAERRAVFLVPQWAKFRPAVIRFLNENNVGIDRVLFDGDAPDKPKAGVEIPPRPKMDLRYGDKTPAVVEWFKRYYPNEYKARYGIRGEGTVTKFRVELNERGEKVRVPYQVDAVIADRKTHLTEKREANEGTDEMYDGSVNEKQ